MSDLVSVIMPVYNSERYVGEAIDSFINQTWTNKELIIINDCSTDSSRDVIKMYNDPRITIIDNESNRGVAFSRNRALRVARGEYITLLDSDDMMHPKKIQKEVEYLQNNQYDVVFTDTTLIDQHGKPIQNTNSEYVSSSLFLPMMLFRNVITPAPATCLYKRKCFINNQYNEDLRHAEDYELNLKLAFTHRFGYISEPLYYYRRHTNNLSNQHNTHLKNELNIITQLKEKEVQFAFGLERFPDAERPYVQLLQGLFELKRQNIDQSIKILTEIHSGYDDIILSQKFYLGVAYYFKTDFIQSYKYFRDALQHERRPDIYNNLAVITYLLKNDINETEQLLRQASILNPEYMDARLNLSNLIQGQVIQLKLTTRELRRNLISYTA